MEVADFFRALVASIRKQGVRDLRYDERAFVAGTRAAVEVAKRARVKLDFSDKAVVTLTREGLDEVEKDGLLAHPNPAYERALILLSSRDAAAGYLQHLLASPRLIERFERIAEAFLVAFRQASRRASA